MDFINVIKYYHQSYELNNPSSLVSIKDIVQPLEGFRLSENQVNDLIFDFTTIGQSKLTQEAREFLVKYKRDIIIEEVIKK